IGGSDFAGDLGSAAGNRGWDGLIDEVAVYATALSAGTIKDHFDCVTTNNAAYHNLILASSPVGYWPLNEPVYTAPNQSTLPLAANIGTDGAELNGTNFSGVTACVA